MSDWKKATVTHDSVDAWGEGVRHFYPDAAEYRIGDLNMTQTVACHCGRRYLTQAQADMCPHESPAPINTQYWASWTDVLPGGSMVYHQSRRIPADGFHGASYDDDR